MHIQAHIIPRMPHTCMLLSLKSGHLTNPDNCFCSDVVYSAKVLGLPLTRATAVEHVGVALYECSDHLVSQSTKHQHWSHTSVCFHFLIDGDIQTYQINSTLISHWPLYANTWATLYKHIGHLATHGGGAYFLPASLSIPGPLWS